MRVSGIRGAAAGAALGVALLAGAARADVTVERHVKSGGFMGFGGFETDQVQKIAGQRQRDTGKMKMSGFLGKMTGDMVNDTITDIPKDRLWTLDHKAKTYTEAPITPPPMKEEPPGRPEEKAGPEEPAKVRVVRNEVTVKETGEARSIAGHDTKRWIVVWVIETEDLETRERSENTMTMDLWNAEEGGDVRALAEAEREYTRAYLKKIGWDMTDAEARKMGLGMVAAMLGGEESLEKGAKEVAGKLAKIKGYPMATGVTWNIKTSGGAAGGPQRGTEGVSLPEVAKGFGGLMAALGKKKGAKPDAPKEAGGSQGGGAVFETYTEIRSIKVGGIPDADFAVPSGYRKANP